MDHAEAMLDLMDGLEARHTPVLQELLLAEYTDMAERVRDFRGRVLVSDTFKNRVKSALTALWSDSVKGGAELTQQFFSEGLKEQKSTVFDLILSNFLSDFGNKTADQIINTTERQIEAMILGGMSRGEAVSAIYNEMLLKLPAMADLRSVIITRTEVHSASQYASLQMALRSSVQLKKVWNTAGDEKVRNFGELGRASEFNHRVMNGVKEQLTTAFAVPRQGGSFEFLLFPGDPRGSAGNIINCRCVQTYERA